MCFFPIMKKPFKLCVVVLCRLNLPTQPCWTRVHLKRALQDHGGAHDKVILFRVAHCFHCFCSVIIRCCDMRICGKSGLALVCNRETPPAVHKIREDSLNVHVIIKPVWPAIWWLGRFPNRNTKVTLVYWVHQQVETATIFVVLDKLIAKKGYEISNENKAVLTVVSGFLGVFLGSFRMLTFFWGGGGGVLNANEESFSARLSSSDSSPKKSSSKLSPPTTSTSLSSVSVGKTNVLVENIARKHVIFFVTCTYYFHSYDSLYFSAYQLGWYSFATAILSSGIFFETRCCSCTKENVCHGRSQDNLGLGCQAWLRPCTDPF